MFSPPVPAVGSHTWCLILITSLTTHSAHRSSPPAPVWPGRGSPAPQPWSPGPERTHFNRNPAFPDQRFSFRHVWVVLWDYLLDRIILLMSETIILRCLSANLWYEVRDSWLQPNSRRRYINVSWDERRNGRLSPSKLSSHLYQPVCQVTGLLLQHLHLLSDQQVLSSQPLNQENLGDAKKTECGKTAL